MGLGEYELVYTTCAVILHYFNYYDFEISVGVNTSNRSPSIMSQTVLLGGTIMLL